MLLQPTMNLYQGIVTMCNEQKINQLKAVDKLLSVNVQDLTQETHIEREMLLLKLKCNKNREELKRLVDIFRRESLM